MAQPPPASTSPRSSSTADRQYKGCSSIQRYEVLSKLGEGTFGEVHKARSLQRGTLVALKKILMHNEKEGFPITALREIKLLKMLDHVNVLRLEEMAIEREKRAGRTKGVIYMVTPYMDHDLSGLLENPDVRFTEPQVKCYMLQLLEGIRYLHDSHILHRDMKAANLLISNKGILQIADFGLARHYDEPVPKAGCGNGEARRDYTTLVVTRWYRPPELLLQLRRYTPAIDMWGVGCVFGEMFKRKPILAGTSDLNQAQIIFDLVGSPTEDNMPGWTALPGCEGVKTFAQRRGNIDQAFAHLHREALSLLKELLKLDWRKRINALDALQHPYFRTEPLPARPEDIPTFEESHELDRRKFRDRKAAPPPAPAGGTVGMGATADWNAAAPNGSYYANGDRTHAPRPTDRRAPYNPDRRGGGPPRPPPGAPIPPPPRAGRQPWPARPDDRDPQQRAHHDLPPRPGGWHGLPDRPPPPPNGRAPAVDTYIPSYGGGPGRGPPPGVRGSRSPRDEQRAPRDWRTNDTPPPPHGRFRDDRERGRGFREDERRRNGAMEYGERRTRSRSPDRGEQREKLRDRERELYRRDDRR